VLGVTAWALTVILTLLGVLGMSLAHLFFVIYLVCAAVLLRGYLVRWLMAFLPLICFACFDAA
jgi:hypothetical protein